MAVYHPAGSTGSTSTLHSDPFSNNNDSNHNHHNNSFRSEATSPAASVTSLQMRQGVEGLGIGTGNDAYDGRRSSEERREGERRRPFKTSLITGPVEKPWLQLRDRRDRWATIIPYVGIAVAICVWFGLGIVGYFESPRHKFCLVLEDNFAAGAINENIWQHEVQLGGYGTGAFDWTTTEPRNSYVQGGALHIVPTLTNITLDDQKIYNGYTVNLTNSGECTSSVDADCALTSNITTGAIIPPVQSARLTTQKSQSIKYGRVEVVARMPKGDWLWPAIWMLPKNNTYGVWPRSGEIDIAESRGNDRGYWPGGNNIVSTALHWGPEAALDAYKITNGANAQPLGDYTQGFHTFGMEWTQDYLYTYVDSRLRQVLYFGFPKSLWTVGQFPANWGLNPLYDIWKRKTAPFDQEFYLVLNVAVGGTNGYFPDAVGEKPWVNGDTVAAKYHFYQNAKSWLPTWPAKESDRGMTVKSVKMWQLCD